MANSHYAKTYSFDPFIKAAGDKLVTEFTNIEAGFDTVEASVNTEKARIDGLETANFFVGTSSSSVTIGTGSKSFVLAETDRAWQVGTQLRMAVDSSNYMDGTVSAYSGTTALTVNVTATAGTGTHTSWELSVGVTQTEQSKMKRFFFANF